MDKMERKIDDNSKGIDRNHSAIMELKTIIRNGLSHRVDRMAFRQWFLISGVILIAGAIIVNLVYMISNGG